jgi:hypothetical protein
MLDICNMEYQYVKYDGDIPFTIIYCRDEYNHDCDVINSTFNHNSADFRDGGAMCM